MAARRTCCTTRCAASASTPPSSSLGDIDGWRAAVRPNTKLFFGETVGNPGLDVLDIPTVSAIAHEAGVPLLVDSTLTSPWLIKPFEHGADLVYHSATKFLSAATAR
jgi:O-acetylhomoserine (thiol)-lyase